MYYSHYRDSRYANGRSAIVAYTPLYKKRGDGELFVEKSTVTLSVRLIPTSDSITNIDGLFAPILNPLSLQVEHFLCQLN